MDNIKVTIDTINDSKVTQVLLMTLSNMNFNDVKVKRYNKIGVIVEINGIIVNNGVYMELLDVLRDIRKLNNLWNSRIEVNVIIDICGHELEYGYFYDLDGEGNIIFDEYGDMELNGGIDNV